MKTMKKVAIVLIALTMISSTNLFAQQGRNSNNQGQGLNENRVCEMIPDLTDDQQSKIEDLRIAHLKVMTDHRNQMNELRAKKQTLMTSDNTDLKEINSVIDQMTQLQNSMMKLKAKHHQDIRAQLTDDQKVYFDSRPMKHKGQGRGHGRQGRGNR